MKTAFGLSVRFSKDEVAILLQKFLVTRPTLLSESPVLTPHPSRHDTTHVIQQQNNKVARSGETQTDRDRGHRV